MRTTPSTRGSRRGGEDLATRAEGEGGGWAASLERHEILKEILTATFWVEAVRHGKPYSVSIRFTGRRAGVSGRPQPGDRFEKVETVEGVVPASGLVSITTRVTDVNPGEWVTTAEPVIRRGHGRWLRAGPLAQRGTPRRVRRWLRLWGKPVTTPGAPTRTRTGLLPFVSPPGIIPGAWPALVALGVLAGLAIQALFIARAHLQVSVALAVSLSACLAGLVGAKAWFLAQRRRTRTSLVSQGLCIQGFIAGVALVWTAAFALLHLPVGIYLDAAAPGLLLGMAIGRPGCFFAGCCVGRPTASRWGVWASDGRVGVRRIPTQLLESLACLALGITTLVLLLLHRPVLPGVLFAGAVAAYTVCRQLLLPFRAEPRQSRIGRPVTMAAAGMLLLAAILLAYLG